MKETLWKAVFDSIKNDISTKYEIGDLIPGDFELASQFEVSRITIRKALDELSKLGYIKRERGKGTVIIQRDQKLQTVVKSSLNYLEEHQVHSRIVDYINEEEVYDQEVLKFFGLEKNTKLLKIIRSSSDENHKIAIYTTFINPIVKIPEGLKLAGSLYQYLDTNGFKLTRFSEVVSTNISTIDQQHSFNTYQPFAILKRLRHGFHKDIPIEYTIAVYNGERYRMKIESDSK